MKVILDKSLALAANVVSLEQKKKLQHVMSISFAKHLEKYLGFKMVQGRLHRDDFAEITNKVNSKLSA